MPDETKNHVPLILASIILAHNPEKYGLSLEFEPPQAYDRVTVSKRVNLRAVAKALDVSVDVLQNLNPALKTLYTPPDDPHFELKVPEGMGADLAEKLASLPAADLKADPSFDGKYRVQPGDTLTEIAAHYRVRVEDLEAANNINSPRSLRAGALLVVPTKGSAAGPCRAGRRFRRQPSGQDRGNSDIDRTALWRHSRRASKGKRDSIRGIASRRRQGQSAAISLCIGARDQDSRRTPPPGKVG